MRKDKVKVMICRFPYGAAEHPDVGDWLVKTVLAIKKDKRIGDVFNIKLNDTPITMTRNYAVEKAKAAKVDYMVMVDSDMAPDCEPGAKPFFPLAFDYAYRLNRPCVIAAPYVGPPPKSMPYVFTFKTDMNAEHQVNPQLQLEMYDRETAAIKSGIEQVAALPTGLILIDMRVFEALPQPYFYYAYTDKSESVKNLTEDVAFTRDVTLAGMPCFVTWDCWAGHHKLMKMTRPKIFTIEQVRETFRDVLLRGFTAKDRIHESPPLTDDELQQLRDHHAANSTAKPATGPDDAAGRMAPHSGQHSAGCGPDRAHAVPGPASHPGAAKDVR